MGWEGSISTIRETVSEKGTCTESNPLSGRSFCLPADGCNIVFYKD